MVNKIAISELCSGNFGGKMSVGGGLGALQFFGHLKRVLELLISVRMSPSAGLNFYIKVLWYAESDDVIFIKIVWLLGGVSPYFQTWGKFSQARNFLWVRLILVKLIYLKSALKCDSFDVTIGIKIPFFRVSVTIELGLSLLQFVTTNCLIHSI